MDLKPTIWISSTRHLEAFDTLLKSNRSWKKFFGFYDVPNDFPFMKQLGAKIPIVYFSKGELTFKDDRLCYNAIKGENNFLSSYYNLNDYLSFELDPSSIKSIEWYPYERKSLRKFKWNWVRITCNEEILDGDFLICADGITNTKKLFEMLNQFKECQPVSMSLNDFSGSKIPLLGYIGLILFLISIVLDLAFTTTYGTINGNIGGPIAVSTLLIGMILSITTIIWYLTKINENSKIVYQWQLFTLVFFIFMMLNAVKNHFYP